MKLKRLLALLLVLIMCFVMVSCKKDTNKKNTNHEDSSSSNQNNSATQSSNSTPLLYRVTDDDGNIAWLFGSIHIGREDFYPLPDYVVDAFEGADSLAVELDIVALEKDTSLQFKALAPLLYNDGTTIKDHISQELYEKAVKILKEYNYYSSVMDMYCASFWSSTIESLLYAEFGGDAELGIDRHMIDMAYESEKEITEIESAEFQYQMMADFDEDVQRMLLESAVQSYEKKSLTSASLKIMMNLWATGNEKAFAKLLNPSDAKMTAEEKQIYNRYQKAMITDRNLTMTDFAEDALSSGDEVFICVGAAHIVGDGAMADLLEERGYTVECITK